MRFRWKAVQYDSSPVPVILPEPLRSEVRRLLVDKQHTDAVIMVREKTGMNLLPAVRAVNALSDAGTERP